MSKRTFGFVFVGAALIFSAVVFNRLPAQIATHFNLHGEPDRWSSRIFGALFLPFFAVILIGIFNLLPRILPRRENFAAFSDSYWLLVNAVIAFMAVAHVATLGRALGWPIQIPAVALLGIGSLFVVLGYVMPRTRSNWILGVRTPWTLDNEEVWRKTHALAGRTFMGGGLVTMAAGFAPAAMQPWIALAALVIAAFVPVVYSYVVWRREQQA